METLAERLKSLTAQQIADLCQVDLATARRWRRQAICPPKSAQILLMAPGDLGWLDPAWGGWLLRKGLLISPEGWEATPGDVRAMQLKEAQVSALRRDLFEARVELAELHRTAPWLDEQPLPGTATSPLKMTKVF